MDLNDFLDVPPKYIFQTENLFITTLCTSSNFFLFFTSTQCDTVAVFVNYFYEPIGGSIGKVVQHIIFAINVIQP